MCFGELGEDGFEFGAAVRVLGDFLVVGDVAVEELVVEPFLVFRLALLLVQLVLKPAVHDISDDPLVSLPGRLRPISLQLPLLRLRLADLHPQFFALLLHSGDGLELVHAVRLALLAQVRGLGVIGREGYAVGWFVTELQEGLGAVFIGFDGVRQRMIDEELLRGNKRFHSPFPEQLFDPQKLLHLHALIHRPLYDAHYFLIALGQAFGKQPHGPDSLLRDPEDSPELVPEVLNLAV